MNKFTLANAVIYSETKPTPETGKEVTDLLHRIMKSEAFENIDGSILYKPTPLTHKLTVRRFVRDFCNGIERDINPTTLLTQGFYITTRSGAVIDVRKAHKPYISIRTVHNATRYEGKDVDKLTQLLLHICEGQLGDIPKFAPLW